MKRLGSVSCLAGEELIEKFSFCKELELRLVGVQNQKPFSLVGGSAVEAEKEGALS